MFDKVQTKCTVRPADTGAGDGGHLHQHWPSHAGGQRSLGRGRRGRGLDEVERSGERGGDTSAGRRGERRERRRILWGEGWRLLGRRRVHQPAGGADGALLDDSPPLLLGMLRGAVLQWLECFPPGLRSELNLCPLVLTCHNGNIPTSIGKSYQIEFLLAVYILNKHWNISKNKYLKIVFIIFLIDNFPAWRGGQHALSVCRLGNVGLWELTSYHFSGIAHLEEYLIQ